jgi:integrase
VIGDHWSLLVPPDIMFGNRRHLRVLQESSEEGADAERGGAELATRRRDLLRGSNAAGRAAIPLFSPHDLRHRRISLLHLGGMPWARIGEFVGQRNLAVTANTYTHVLVDEAELDYGELLARAA